MSFEDDFIIIRKLTEIQGCSGNEIRIRQYIKEIVESYCDKIETDILGNLFCFLNGQLKSNADKLKILLDAHIDEKSLNNFMVR